MNETCPLCQSNSTNFFSVSYGRPFHLCSLCGLIFIDPKHLLSPDETAQRYHQHENNLTDLNYLKWCQTFLDKITPFLKPADSILDYGAGPVKVFAHLLPNHYVQSYDPLFFPEEKKLEEKYDVIICQEVVEHFIHVKNDWDKMISLLRPDGQLFIRTSLWSAAINFETWYYPKDLTHVCIYSQKSVEWLKKSSGLKERLKFY